MRRAALFVVCALIAGCGPDPYREAIRKQVSKQEELADLLAEVKDAKSMSDIEASIADRMEAFQRAANRAAKLPHPDPGRIQAYKDEFGEKMTSAFVRYTKEVERIRGLPGGPEFLDRVGKLQVGASP
jgi:hypothetical protein